MTDDKTPPPLDPLTPYVDERGVIRAGFGVRPRQTPSAPDAGKLK